MKLNKLLALLIVFILTALLACSCGGASDGNGDNNGDVGGGTDDGNGTSDKLPNNVKGPDLSSLGAEKLNGTLTDKYGFLLNASSNAKNYVEIAKVGGSDALRFVKGGTAGALTFKLTPPKSDGGWYSFGAKITVDSASDSESIFEVNIGRMFAVRLTLVSGSVLLYDLNAERYGNLIENLGDLGDEFELYVEFSNGDKREYDTENNLVSANMQAFIYINGEIVARSGNYFSADNIDKTEYGDLTVTFARDTEAEVVMKDIKARASTAAQNSGKTTTKYSRADQYTEFYQREKLWAQIIGEDAAHELVQSSERLFEPAIYSWLANLYDPASGVFYYSNSARDYFGYLPSIDNLGQGISILVSLGLGNSGNDIMTEEHKARITAWAGLYHSGRDGYFYHPQWGSAASDSRRGRDLTSLVALYTNYGNSAFLFSDANYRLSGGTSGNAGSVQPLTYALSTKASVAVSPVVKLASKAKAVSQFGSEAELVSYLDGLWTRYSGDSYQAGSTVASQAGEIRAAGLSKACIDWLNEKQKSIQDELIAEGKNPNGIWEKNVNYRTVSGLLKISGIYNTLGYAFNYPDAALESAIKVMTADIEDYDPETSGIVYVYNPPRAIENILINQKSFNNDPTLSKRILEILRDNAEDIILVTEDKLTLYKKTDGSFSYYPTHSSETSQNSPAAVKGMNEGDVNATSLALGTRTALFSIFGIKLMPVLSPNPEDAKFDLDGDGEKETVGHLAKFRALMGEVDHVEKTDSRYSGGTYLFGEGDELPTLDANYAKNGTISVNDGVLSITDNNASGGFVVYFNSGVAEDHDNKAYFSGTMRYTAKPTATTVHQLFMDGLLKIDFKYRNGYISFTNRYKLSDTGSTEYDEQLVDIATGKTISLVPTEFFDFCFEVYPEGTVYQGNTYYAKAIITQNEVTYTSYLVHTRVEDISSLGYTHSRLFSLSSTTGTVEMKNVRAKSTDRHYGDYTFDRSNELPAGVVGGEMVIGKDNALLVNNGTVTLRAASAVGKYNMNEAELDMLLKSGSGSIALTDGSGRTVTSVKYLIDGDTLTLTHGKSEQVLLSVKLDKTEKITLRLEYHYDMESPTMFLHLRYKNAETGFMKCDAAELRGMDVSDSGATPASYAALAVTAAEGSVTVDNVFVRNFKK